MALRYGRGPSMLTTLLSALVRQFLFAFRPIIRFKIADEQHFITFTFIADHRHHHRHAKRSEGTDNADHPGAASRRKIHSSLFGMSRELSANRGKTYAGADCGAAYRRCRRQRRVSLAARRQGAIADGGRGNRGRAGASTRCVRKASPTGRSPIARTPGSAPIRCPAPRRSTCR